MIKLSKKELTWGINNLKFMALDIENKSKLIDKDYLVFITNLSNKAYENIKYLLDNLDKININEEINKKFIDTLDEINGFWYWQDYDTRDEVKKYIDDDMFLNYVGKIYGIWGYKNS